jgi:hypothetical protein
MNTPTPNATLTPRKATSQHGGGIRGTEVLRRSAQFEGRFGRMFRTLPPAEFDLNDIAALAAAMVASPEIIRDAVGEPVRDPRGFFIPKATPETQIDDEENFGIPAGYTYLGQFIDHDLTFDPASSLQKLNDPDGLVDFRTPRFDLDCVYGRGPDDQPYLFDGSKFLLGRKLTEGPVNQGASDLLRIEANGRAVIGDKRNDENVIVSQLQGIFLRFHNAVADALPAGTPFAEIQLQVRWHYQWVVLHDFLKRIVGDETFFEVLPHLKHQTRLYDEPPKLQFFAWREEAYIPIEFTAAAYRFGHSMVRPIYRLNTELGADASDDEKARGVAGRQFIFAAVQDEGLNGFRPFPADWGIDWSLYFELDRPLSPESLGASRVQPSYKIDASLVNPLAFLPEFSKPGLGGLERDADGRPVAADPNNNPSNLALRNLLRGISMALPSGQAVARHMGYQPLPDEAIRIGKATFDDDVSLNNPPITAFGESFKGQAPLWAYILAEAQYDWRQRIQGKSKDDANTTPAHLGQVGGRIVAEVFVGLLLGDSHSFLSQDPGWTPVPGPRGHFDINDLVRIALGQQVFEKP